MSAASELRQAAEALRGDSLDLMDPAIAVSLSKVLDLLASNGEAGLSVDLPTLYLARAINGTTA